MILLLVLLMLTSCTATYMVDDCPVASIERETMPDGHLHRVIVNCKEPQP
jgi:hypothetical protein